MGKALDKFDIALLNLLQENNLATAEALTVKVPLSPSAITRRLRRLREDGWVAADISLLSPAFAERRLKAVVHIQLDDHALEGSLAAFRERMCQAKEVQYLVEISGAFDMMAIIVARDMAAFNAFADGVLAANPAVRRYETSFVKKEAKNCSTIELDARDLG